MEPDLATYVSAAVAEGRLTAHLEIPNEPAGTVFIIAVPTPVASNHGADLQFIDQAADAIIPHLCGGELVILESTSPPGTTRYIAERVLAARPDLSLDDRSGRQVVQFAHCPERVLPGRVMIELVTNDRIIGGLTPKAAERARDLYARFSVGELHLTDATTAELAKLTENSFRDVNIAFANELSVIADHLGVDVFELISLANKHPRVNILQPGPGVGGHCIAVDPWFIVAAAPQQSQLVRAAREVNDNKPHFVLDQIIRTTSDLEKPTIACLGLAFKPNIDDLRGSPSVQIVANLAKALPQAALLAVEPNISELPPLLAERRNVRLTELSEALTHSDIVVLLVDHRQFRRIDHEALQEKRVIDTKGVFGRIAD